MKQAAILMIGAVMAGQAQAVFVSGEELLRRIKSQDDFEGGVGVGYVLGIADRMRYTKAACIGPSVKATQIQEVVVRGLEAQPDFLRFSADSLVAARITQAFPCPAKK